MFKHVRRSITEIASSTNRSPRYYATQRRFTLATGWLLPGNLGGIADRLLLADLGFSLCSGSNRPHAKMRSVLDRVGGSTFIYASDGDSSHRFQGAPVKRHSPVHSYFVPFMLWSDLGVKTLETMLGAAQVIAHRTTRIVMAGHAPNAGDRREFVLMGQEKMEAGAKSAQAMAAHMLSMTQPWGALVYRDFLQNCAALMSLSSSRTLNQLLARQAALALTLGQSAANMADTSKTVTRLAHRGLKPIHAKVVANAKRLGRR